ncbi:MAG: hypothetical protein ACRYFV_08965 [Janthinobacterium lividum]
MSISEAQNWYQTTYPGLLTATASDKATTSLAATTPATTPAAQLVWQQALTAGTGAQQLLLVPFAGDAALFAHGSFTGLRYLIIAKQTTNTLDGKVLEFLLPRTAQPVDTLALFTSLYRSYQRGSLVAPAQGEGYVFLYSATYQYLTGRRFEHGRFLPGAARLAFQLHPGTATSSTTKSAIIDGGATTNMASPIGATCLDWYSGETGKYITTTGDCSYGGGGDVPPVYTGGGGPAGGGSPGPSGYGGGGGGGSSNTSITATTVLVVPPDRPVNDIRQFLKCFTVSQGATYTVYAKQPVPGTTDTYVFGPNGIPIVGHTFISITQNGITRVLGFYPTSSAAPLGPVTSVMGDDSQHPFDVSITTPISPNSLNNVLNYLYASLSNTYSLQNNNCTDIGIGASAQTGLILPDTQGTWGGVWGGSNPANLGQDMRTVTLPTGATRNTTGGTAPANQGGC